MKRTVFTAAVALPLALASCAKGGEAKAPPPAEEAAPGPAPAQEPSIIEEKQPEPAPPPPEPEPEPEPAPEPEPPPPPPAQPAYDEPEPPVAEVEPEQEPEAPDDEEYARSVGSVDVDKDTFEADKAEILGIIDELAEIMGERQYGRWLPYVDSESVSYWSKPAHLRKASARLPVKGLKLKSLEDYFKLVFVPARQGRRITEIRYVSETYVKAVDVQDDADLIYYYFRKVGGSWKVNLPPLGG